MKSTKLYLGYRLRIDGNGQEATLFRSEFEPTHASHGHRFIYVVGPFRTKAGAEFMRDYGRNNPHCQHVSDAERLAKQP